MLVAYARPWARRVVCVGAAPVFPDPSFAVAPVRQGSSPCLKVFPLAQCRPVGSGPAPTPLQARGLLVLVYAAPESFLPGESAFFFGPACVSR